MIPLAGSELPLLLQVGTEAPTGQESQDAHHCLCGEPCGGQREGCESKWQLGKLGGTHLGMGFFSPQESLVEALGSSIWGKVDMQNLVFLLGAFWKVS